jgi:hypothetical protein
MERGMGWFFRTLCEVGKRVLYRGYRGLIGQVSARFREGAEVWGGYQPSPLAS